MAITADVAQNSKNKTYLSAPEAIVAQNGEKVFVVKQATSGSTANVDLSTAVDVDNLLVIPTAPPPGYQLQNSWTLVLQADQDFFYTFTDAGSATVDTTKAVLVLANQQEWVSPKSSRRFLNVIQSTAGGTVKLFIIRYG